MMKKQRNWRLLNNMIYKGTAYCLETNVWITLLEK
jgi:hypothetical protein